LPLPSPILDHRSYQQLRDELVRRIPIYTPEWTDHNPSDPGITLIELFAFLGENLLFRFNQIPDATKLAFLRMLQIPLRPAAAARAMVTLVSSDPTGAPVDFATATGPVDFQKSADGAIWIAMRRTKNTDLAQLKSALINLGFIPDPEMASIDQAEGCPGIAPVDSGSEMIWEASTGVIDAAGTPLYTSIKVESDTTRALTSQGVVQLRLPDPITALGAYALADPDLAGTDNFPPQIEDQQLAVNVIF
jgi:predicted phage baseplate assembly protein